MAHKIVSFAVLLILVALVLIGIVMDIRRASDKDHE
jgi:hypothetical protein